MEKWDHLQSQVTKTLTSLMHKGEERERQEKKGILSILNQRPPLAYFVVVMRE